MIPGMPAVRLVFLVALVAGVLAAIAASTTVQRDSDDTGSTPAPNTAVAPLGATVRATVPHDGPLEVRLGDTVSLSVELPRAARLVIPALGVHEDIGPDVAMPVIFTPTRVGTYELEEQATGRSVLRIIVRPARADAPPAGAPAQPTTEQGGAVSA
jgi:hypothetical protein